MNFKWHKVFCLKAVTEGTHFPIGPEFVLLSSLFSCVLGLRLKVALPINRKWVHC